MRSFENSEVYILMAMIGVIAIILGFFGGILTYSGHNSVCPHYIEEKVIVKYVNVTDLDFCLEYIKESDQFQKELYEKRWINDR